MTTQQTATITEMPVMVGPSGCMPAGQKATHGEYALATGAAAVRRLEMLQRVYSPAGRRFLLQAGLSRGMRVADFGCGVGLTSRMLAGIVEGSGAVTGIDANAQQLAQAEAICRRESLKNVTFVQADACHTGLPGGSFDLVYCRFLLLHLPDPMSCLREMRRVLKPGGTIVVEDGELSTVGSSPATALNACADLFNRLGPVRGLNYSMARNLFHIVKAAGFSYPKIEIHQPAIARGENRYLLKWSVEEAGPAFVSAGLITSVDLGRLLSEMQAATEDEDVLVLMPRMSQVCGRK